VRKRCKNLYWLLDLQNHAARWLLHVLTEEDHTSSQASVTICVTDDVFEAGTLGWPAPYAMNAAVRRLLEMAGDDLRSRIQLAFNPGPSSDIYFLSVRLRPDGTFRAPEKRAVSQKMNEGPPLPFRRATIELHPVCGGQLNPALKKRTIAE
jgi:hypothetical protein